MRAALVQPDGGFRLEDLPDPSPGPGELVLRVTGCGVCGSDLKARPAMPAGTQMGHEFCGEVVAVGAGAEPRWKVGVHAATLPVFSCGTCVPCRQGDVVHCAGAQLIGLGGAPGGFAELVRVSAAHSVPLPRSLPVEHGALVEPYVVGLHTARAAGIEAGNSVLVVGGGPVGLTTSAWARAMGAGDITVSDPAERRRNAAASFGATNAIDPGEDGLGGPYDVVIECVGKPGLLDACVGAVATHGRIVLAGACIDVDSYLPVIALMKELTIRFSVYYRPEEFRTVVDAFASGEIDPSPLLTRTAGLGDLDDVFASLSTSPEDLKVVIDPSRVESVPLAARESNIRDDTMPR